MVVDPCPSESLAAGVDEGREGKFGTQRNGGVGWMDKAEKVSILRVDLPDLFRAEDQIGRGSFVRGQQYDEREEDRGLT